MAVDVLPDLLILESNGIAFSKDESDFVDGFSGKCDNDVLSGVEMIPSETDTEVMDLDMETIDLSPDMKHDETSMILKGNSVHSASRGIRNFKYYKKLIQDALTSRQRLSKEYERLAILQELYCRRHRIRQRLSKEYERLAILQSAGAILQET